MHPTTPSPLRLLAALVITGLLLSTPVAADAAVTSGDDVDILDWVNDHRERHGLPALLAADDLDAVAATQSRRMADQDHLHHNPALGDEVRDWRLVAENVGVSTGSVRDILVAFEDSAPHRANLLDPELQELGVATVWRGDKRWVTQVFRRPFVSPYAQAGADATRLGGDDQLQTAVAVSRSTFERAEAVYLARVDQLADAVAGGALTAGPVLFVPRCGDVPPVVRQEIDRLDPARVVALGGSSAICDELLAEAAAGRLVRRAAGRDRYATSVAISQEEFTDRTASVAYLARGDVFTDAVAAGALTDGPILLVPSCGAVPAAVADELDRLDVDRVVGLGGPAAICNATLVGAAEGRAASRLAGADRYDTAVRIAASASGGASDTIYLARADDLADAVAGGSLRDGPVVLVPPCGQLPTIVAQAIDDLAASRVVPLGSDRGLCDDIVGQALHQRRR